jgi:Transglutaminase-like enzymes, putative cysteine proteases
MSKLIEKGMEIYLKPTFTIEANHKKIIETARNLTKDCFSNKDKAVKLFYFVRDSIPYNLYMISVFVEDFKASRVLEWGKGYCVQKAVLLTALGRAADIPSRLIFATIRNHRLPAHIVQMIGGNVLTRHGYNQFFLSGKWVNAVATFDKNLCEENGFPSVEFDGEKDALLPAKDLEGRPYIEYVEKFYPTNDLPFDWIYERISKRVGPNKRSWPQKNDITNEVFGHKFGEHNA